MKSRKRINSNRADDLYVQLLSWLTQQARYRTGACAQDEAAAYLGVSVYTLSAAVKQSAGVRYNDIVNRLRLRDACAMLADPACAHITAEDVGLTAGFASRQAFYTAFRRYYEFTPNQYRAAHCPREE
ncbi:MAG: helix-turn-helix transcriptional regulator [Bacteroidaceae bacterium]|nr:helix-turn-helix transcriptional regulator [Bacteroidaceae bacterium]